MTAVVLERALESCGVRKCLKEEKSTAKGPKQISTCELGACRLVGKECKDHVYLIMVSSDRVSSIPDEDGANTPRGIF